MKTLSRPAFTLSCSNGPTDRNSDTYAAKYVPLGYRTASPDEIKARHTAQDLKIPSDAAIQIAAPAMAALIDGPCWLAPVPASDGSLTANLALARAIAEMVPGARVKCAIGRARPVESSHTRRLRGLPRLTIDQHAIIRTTGPMTPLTVYFVDNVITTGTTIAACRRALGWGIGLAYSDASKPHRARGISFMRDRSSRLSRQAAICPVQELHDQPLLYSAWPHLPRAIRVDFGGTKHRSPVYPWDYVDVQ